MRLFKDYIVLGPPQALKENGINEPKTSCGLIASALVLVVPVFEITNCAEAFLEGHVSLCGAAARASNWQSQDFGILGSFSTSSRFDEITMSAPFLENGNKGADGSGTISS
jgi:hypothetical protein